MKQNNHQKGVQYEAIAARYLERNGYLILEQNYRCHYGEIDIIAEQQGTLVFVEIKYRQSDRYGSPSTAVDYRKRRHISRTALHYYSYHGYEQEKPCRFDVIEIQGRKIRHLINAFEYEE